MKTKIAALAVLIPLAAASALRADEGPDMTTIETGAVSDWALAKDGVTLVLALPEKGALQLVDSTNAKLGRAIDVPFAPERLALQGDTLFATAKGSGQIHAIDLATGKVTRTISIPGVTLAALACHARSGPIFAAADDDTVFVISEGASDAKRTNAIGTLLTVDPNDANVLFTASVKPGEEFIDFSGNHARFVTTPDRAAIRRYEVQSDGAVRLVGANANAAVGFGSTLHVSPDGRLVGVAAGGGWQRVDDLHRQYVVALFETSDMTTMRGQVEVGAYPAGFAWHPELDLGAACTQAGEIKLWKASSLVARASFKVKEGSTRPLLAFAGKGARLVFAANGKLSVIELPLSDDEKKKLAAKHGALPGPLDETAVKAKSGDAGDRSRLVDLDPKYAGEWDTVRLAPGARMFTDGDAAIATLPKALEGGTLLVRRRGQLTFWLSYPNQVTATTACTVYVAIATSMNGHVLVTPAQLKALAAEGWEPFEGELTTRGTYNVREPQWTIVKKDVKRGGLELKTKTYLGGPGGYIFMFK